MYHCHVHFYFIGHQHRIMDVVKEMSPLDNFTHEFSEGDVPEAEMAAKADVIFADLQNMDVEQTLSCCWAGNRVCLRWTSSPG